VASRATCYELASFLQTSSRSTSPATRSRADGPGHVLPGDFSGRRISAGWSKTDADNSLYERNGEDNNQASASAAASRVPI
jgi:hypothetical protein